MAILRRAAAVCRSCRASGSATFAKTRRAIPAADCAAADPPYLRLVENPVVADIESEHPALAGVCSTARRIRQRDRQVTETVLSVDTLALPVAWHGLTVGRRGDRTAVGHAIPPRHMERFHRRQSFAACPGCHAEPTNTTARVPRRSSTACPIDAGRPHRPAARRASRLRIGACGCCAETPMQTCDALSEPTSPGAACAWQPCTSRCLAESAGSTCSRERALIFLKVILQIIQASACFLSKKNAFRVFSIELSDD